MQRAHLYTYFKTWLKPGTFGVRVQTANYQAQRNLNSLVNLFFFPIQGNSYFFHC